MMQRSTITIYPPAFYHGRRTLFKALEDLFHVTFQPCQGEAIGDHHPALLWNPPEEVLDFAQRTGVKLLIWETRPSRNYSARTGTVTFADHPSLDVSIRGQQIEETQPVALGKLNLAAEDAILAERSSLPLWTRRVSARGSMDFLAVEPPELAPGELLREHLHAGCVSPLIPLMHFLREVTAESAWETGPRRACFIFDDPSLYWPTYGFLRFQDLALHAERHRYHAAIATVPLDTWWVHPRVAAVFRDHPKRISLLIHGNNHSYLELGQTRSESDCLAILAQALRRFARLDDRHGLRFSRVMEAPHGVISDAFLGPLASLGYEAALYTPSQFIRFNRGKPWPASLGTGSLDVFPQGLGAIPRLVMSEHWRADVMIAAFLRQPVVLAGHHQDLRAGLGFLAEFAARVNRLGNVRWSNPSEIARSRFISRREGSSWVVRLGARTVECRVPSGVTQVVIERPWIQDETEPLVIQGAAETAGPLRLLAGAVSEPVPWRLEAGGELSIESPPKVLIAPNSVAPPPRQF